MMLTAAVACTLTATIPTAVISVAPGGCVGDSIRPATILRVKVLGQTQRADGRYGPRDVILASLALAPGSEGQTLRLITQLPDSCIVLRVRAVESNGAWGCESNPKLWNARRFNYPSYRPPRGGS